MVGEGQGEAASRAVDVPCIQPQLQVEQQLQPQQPQEASFSNLASAASTGDVKA